MNIFSKSGGYRSLDSFTFATVIQLGTLRFCETFLNRTNDPCGRLYDQMTQAARSGRSNIIEGSERSATSKETEMKLTSVALGSLGELRGDFEMWLLKLGQPTWRRASPEARAVSAVDVDRPEFGDDPQYESTVHLLAQAKKFAPWLESGDSIVVANAMLILIRRTIGMLIHQLEAQGEIFLEEGGFRENLTKGRVETRAKQEMAPVCPACGKAMKKRNSARGEFWGCTGYPECKGTRPGEGEGQRDGGTKG